MSDIEYKTGDLLKAAETVIAHGCNALGGFASGVAGAIRRTEPDAWQAYAAAHAARGLKLGKVIWAQGRNHVIANCITQPTYGRDGRRHVDYEAVRVCMRELNASASAGVPGTKAEGGFSRVAMPLIGAGLGGGDWKVISAIIEEEMTLAVPVVYTLDGRIP